MGQDSRPFSPVDYFPKLNKLSMDIVLELTGFTDNGDTPIIGENVVRILKKGKVKPPKSPKN